MTEIRTCPECGAPLASDAPEGFCPACMLEGALRVGEAENSKLRVQSQSGRFGDYELIEEIARGGMGVVYKARQKSLDRIVALKMLLFGQHAGADLIRRFKAEAVAAGSLHHPNIVAIHEVGIHEGQHFIVMDYVDGPNLANFVREQPLSGKRAAEHVKVIAEAIHYAHEHGILHRDLKPSNVLIDSNDQPRVTDFGLARRIEGDSSLTLTGQVLGSPNYMPPEQAAADRGKLSRRSDVYGLGAILYYLLTGRPPFQGENITDTLHQVFNSEPLSPRLLQHRVPVDLETICLKCLQKEPDRRYHTAKDLAEELTRFGKSEPILARPVGQIEKLWRWSRRHPAISRLLLLLLLTLSAGLAGIVWQWRRAEERSEILRRNLYVAQMNVAIEARRESNIGLALDLLEAQKPRRGEEDLRGFEWLHMWQMLHQEVATMRADSNAVNTAIFSPDGRTIVSAGEDGTIKVWDAKSFELIRTLVVPPDLVSPTTIQLLEGRSAPDGWIQSLSFFPDGRRLVSCGADGTIRIWDVAAGRHLSTFAAGTNSWFPAQVSPDGHWIAAVDRASVLNLWDVKTETCVARAQGIEFNNVREDRLCAFSSDSKQIAISCLSNVVKVLTVPGLDEEVQLPFQPMVAAIALSPDRSMLAIGLFDLSVQRFDLRNRTMLAPLRAKGFSLISSLAFSPDSRLLAATSFSGAVLVWDARSAEVTATFEGHAPYLYAVSFSPDGQHLVTAGNDGYIKVWNASGATHMPLSTSSTGEVWRIAFSPTASMLAVLYVRA
ncbi:MAG: protein kinase [Verrucomicrobia subdivision 3 bacterium]|nr:protein kinase [Limisphaerales bacterium]